MSRTVHHVPQSRFVLIHTIVFDVTEVNTGTPYQIVIDPKFVKEVAWNPEGLERLKRKRIAFEDINLVDAPEGEVAPGISITPGTPLPDAAGVKHALHFTLAAAAKKTGRRFPGVIIHQVTVHYESRKTHVPYVVTLPVTATNTDVVGERDPHTSIDLMFWTKSECRKYWKDHNVQGPPHMKLADGRYEDGRVDDEPRVRTMVDEHQFASDTCSLCYHYGDCTWECREDPPK